MVPTYRGRRVAKHCWEGMGSYIVLNGLLWERSDGEGDVGDGKVFIFVFN